MQPDSDTRSAEYGRVQEQIASAVQETAAASMSATGLTDTSVPERELRRTHSDLLNAYQEVVNALDTVEQELDNFDNSLEDTPREIISEHSMRVREQYDDPVRPVALTLLEWNRRHWLQKRPGTLGAKAVERHGFTDNQRAWINRLQNALDGVDDETQ